MCSTCRSGDARQWTGRWPDVLSLISTCFPNAKERSHRLSRMRVSGRSEQIDRMIRGDAPMNRFWLPAAMAILSTATWISFPGSAETSEWGCEVLLCASSSNPSWRGVPACHPPMYRLISAMGRPGFSWPTCPDAGTGKPGYERYEECPAGWTVGSSDPDRRGGTNDLCVQARNSCPSGFGISDGCQQTVSIQRPLRADPYYFDIPTDASITRHWFNLRK